MATNFKKTHFNFFKFQRSYYDSHLSKYDVLKKAFSSNSKNISKTAVTSCVSKINVFYESFYYAHVSESPQITPSTLLGTIGLF